MAIVAKDRPWLTNAVGRHPELIDQPNALGQTALHLSVYWPEGLQYLLDAGAEINARDVNGYTPVFYAGSLLLHEPLIMLAGKDCLLHVSRVTSRVEPLLQHVVRKKFDYGNDTSEEILDTLIRVVVERRRQLEALARASLGAKAVRKLRLSTEAVLDHKTSRVVSMLRKKTDVPASLTHLTREHSTVYHMDKLTLRLVQRLWDAGFREIDKLDQWGLSPLMALSGNSPLMIFSGLLTNDWDWEIAAWLVANGARIHRRQKYVVFNSQIEDERHQTACTTALHYLAYRLGFGHEITNNRPQIGLLEFFHWTRFLSKQARRLIAHVLTDPLPDCCNCACSAAGCRAYTTMAKSLVSWHNLFGIKSVRILEVLLQVSQTLAQVFKSEQSKLAWLRREIIRFNTFQKLDLRHTCCSGRNVSGPNMYVICDRYDDEEIHEIQEEQAEQLEKLEALLLEFEEKYEECGTTLDKFLGGYWSDRMNEVLIEEGPVDHEALKNMGIVLRKEDS